MSESNTGQIGVWGRRGSGKSSYLQQRIAKAKRVVIFDTMGEYGQIRGIKAVSRIDQVRQEMRKNWTGFRVALKPIGGREPAILSELSYFLIQAQAPSVKAGRNIRPITLVVEEMNLAFPVSGGEAKCPGFAELCSRGRHSYVEMIGASQRIAEVSTRFRGNCTETVVFAQKGPRDLAASEAELGLGLRKLGADVADLAPYEVEKPKSIETHLPYLHENKGTVTKGEIVHRVKK